MVKNEIFKKKELLEKIIIIISLIVSITPAMFKYYYDLPYLFIIFYICIKIINQKIKKGFYFFLFFIFLFIILKFFLDKMGLSSFQGLHKALSDLRFLFFFVFTILICKQKNLDKIIWISILIIVLINLLFTLFAYFEPNLYRKIIQLYFGNYYFVPSTGIPVSLTAFNQGGRITGIMQLPIFCGTFFITLSYLSLLHYRYLNLNFFVFLLANILFLFFIISANSSVIYLYPFILLVYLLLRYQISIVTLMFLGFLIIMIIISSSILMNQEENLLLFVNRDLLGERFMEHRQMYQAWSRIDVSFMDMLIGFSPADKGEYGKGFDDMAYNSRIVFGGTTYVIYFYFMVFYMFYESFKDLWRLWTPLFLTGLLVDLGGSFFSYPHVGWIMIISIVYTLNQLKKNRRI
jgi:hypothetical protein